MVVALLSDLCLNIYFNGAVKVYVRITKFVVQEFCLLRYNNFTL